MAIAFEGTSQTNSASASSRTVTLTSTGANRRFLVHALCNSGPITSVTSANLTFTRWGRSTTTGATVEIWYADAASALTSEVITVTQTGTGYITVCGTCAYGDGGALIEFDANGSNPTVGTADTSGTISTDESSTRIVGLYRSNSSPTTTPDGAWTGIDSNQYIMVEYKDYATTQSGLTVPVMTNTGTNGWVIYALKEAASSAVKTIDGLARASVKTVNDLAIASVKTWNGLT